MKERDEIVAFYTDEGKRYFQIGHKKDLGKTWNTDNVEWKLDKNGRPLKTEEYSEAYLLCFGKKWNERSNKHGNKIQKKAGCN